LLNEKGQAYSTFKLLIAAIVAMAILAILIPIIMQVMGLITANPTDEAKQVMSALIDSPGSLKTTKNVTFSPESDLTGSALAERLAISQDQICMSTGQFESVDADESGFQCLGCDDSDSSQHRIIYHGQSDKVVKIAIVCNRWTDDSGNDGLAADLEDYGLDDFDNSDAANDIVDNCDNLCSQGDTCCALVLKRT
jgi:hypothetical protein